MPNPLCLILLRFIYYLVLHFFNLVNKKNGYSRYPFMMGDYRLRCETYPVWTYEVVFGYCTYCDYTIPLHKVNCFVPLNRKILSYAFPVSAFLCKLFGSRICNLTVINADATINMSIRFCLTYRKFVIVIARNFHIVKAVQE